MKGKKKKSNWKLEELYIEYRATLSLIQKGVQTYVFCNDIAKRQHQKAMNEQLDKTLKYHEFAILGFITKKVLDEEITQEEYADQMFKAQCMMKALEDQFFPDKSKEGEKEDV